MFRHPSLCFLTWNLAYSLDTLTSKKAWQEALWKYPYQTPVPSWPLAQHPPTAIILSPDFWVHHRKGREDNCHLQTSFQTPWYHPPFQEVLARSVRALMPLAAMMRSFFCICEELDPLAWCCFLENIWSYHESSRWWHLQRLRQGLWNVNKMVIICISWQRPTLFMLLNKYIHVWIHFYTVALGFMASNWWPACRGHWLCWFQRCA